MREKELRRWMPKMWYVPAEFELYEVGDWLTDAEVRKYSRICPLIKIDLHFEYTPEDREVGIMTESFDWNGNWSLPACGNYPEKVKDAIDSFLGSIDVDARWGQEAAKQADSYINSLTQ